MMNEHLVYEDLKGRLQEYKNTDMAISDFCDIFPEVTYFKIGEVDGHGSRVDSLSHFVIREDRIGQVFYTVNGTVVLVFIVNVEMSPRLTHDELEIFKDYN